MVWYGNVGIFYKPPDIYYVVEFDGEYKYSIGDYDPERVRRHRRCISAICSKLGIGFFGYKGASIYVYGCFPYTKKIVRVRCKYGDVYDIEDADDYNGVMLYATSGPILYRRSL